ncbi:MAG: hypothetical protein ACJAYF_000921 [Arenicella sp.]|jgi:hypothetical protein
MKFKQLLFSACLMLGASVSVQAAQINEQLACGLLFIGGPTILNRALRS